MRYTTEVQANSEPKIMECISALTRSLGSLQDIHGASVLNVALINVMGHWCAEKPHGLQCIEEAMIYCTRQNVRLTKEKQKNDPRW